MGLLKNYTKEEKSWMMYDWANSAHSVVVVTILPIFYETISANSVSAIGRWGVGTSAAMLLTALFAPVLGAFGDFQGFRKKLFTAFMLLGVLACAGMALTPFMDVSTGAAAERVGVWILGLYIVSTIGYAGANLYYDSFLTDVTSDERMDRVSTMGYGLGYIGGSTIPLLLFLLMNLAGVPMSICLSFAFGLTAVWWLAFSAPLLKNVHQAHSVPRHKGAIKEALHGLSKTAGEISRTPALLVFLIAYFFYIDGVNTIIHMSTIYGSALNIDSTQMLLALLLVQMLGLPFALLYTRLADRYGARTMVGVGILVYMFICVFGFFVRSVWQFWVLAVLVATSQGGIQALSRSMFGKMIPDKNRSSEFFGFYDVFGKFSAIIGPSLFGGVAALASSLLYKKLGVTAATATAEVAEAVAKQAAPFGVLSVLLIFLVGGGLYFFVLPKYLPKKEASKGE